MPWSPAQRVSHVLRKHGIATVSIHGRHREGIKVMNLEKSGPGLQQAREMGMPVVAVRIDFDHEDDVITRQRGVIEVLAGAGFDCEVMRSSAVWVREPGWQQMLSPLGRSFHGLDAKEE